jgi:hypothetical protein
MAKSMRIRELEDPLTASVSSFMESITVKKDPAEAAGSEGGGSTGLFFMKNRKMATVESSHGFSLPGSFGF